jgi:subtilisin
VVAVGATDKDDSVADFSSRGVEGEDDREDSDDPEKEIDLVAPGVDIYSTMPGGNYASFDGTSFAAPHVAGAAAILIANGDGGPKSTLKDNAEDIENDDPDAVGAGLLDVAAAVGVDSSDDLGGEDRNHTSGVFGSGVGPSL